MPKLLLGHARSPGRMLAAIIAHALALGGFATVAPLPTSAHATPTAARAADPVITPGWLSMGGIPRVGGYLDAVSDPWQPAPVTLSYQWYRGNDKIEGATRARYNIVLEDLGQPLYVVVTGNKPGYPETSASTAANPMRPTRGRIIPPSDARISGTPKVGGTVSVLSGAWIPDSVALNYEWFYGDQAVSNSNSSTHMIRPEGRGKELSVQVTGSQTGYLADFYSVTGGTITSDGPTEDLPFVKAPLPTIASMQQPTGLYFSAVPGEWEPMPALSYQWLRAGAAIPGAESEHYKPTAADAGKPISVRVTAVKAGYVTTSRTSVPMLGPGAGPAKPVVKRLSATPKPKISGTARVGKKLSVRAGSWKPAKVSLSYRWLRNGKAIKGATKARYKLTRKDRGKRISVRVTGKKAGYVTVSKTSDAKRVR